jgi:hypothetical protein
MKAHFATIHLSTFEAFTLAADWLYEEALELDIAVRAGDIPAALDAHFDMAGILLAFLYADGHVFFARQFSGKRTASGPLGQRASHVFNAHHRLLHTIRLGARVPSRLMLVNMLVPLLPGTAEQVEDAHREFKAAQARRARPVRAWHADIARIPSQFASFVYDVDAFDSGSI